MEVSKFSIYPKWQAFFWRVLRRSVTAVLFLLFSVGLAGVMHSALSLGEAFAVWGGVLALNAVTLLWSSWPVIAVKCTNFAISEHQLEVRQGVLNKTNLTYDLTKIKKIDMTRPLWDRVFKLSNIILYYSTADLRGSIVLYGIPMSEAEPLMGFLQANCVDNYVEYRRRGDK